MFSDLDLIKFLQHDSEFSHRISFRESLRDSLDDPNCTMPAIMEFPNWMRQKSWISAVASFFISMYLFIVLAIVCDDYLVPAMERLCYSLRLTYDVAGATFLAAATSAPELFINFVATFITQGDIGLGTIVGSSVFNILVIPAICGILAQPNKLDWWPVTRDTIWYLVAITALTIVLWDSLVFWYEAVGLLLLYCIYLIQLILDRRIQNLVRKEHTESELMNENPMTREDEPLQGFKDQVCRAPELKSNTWQWIWWLIKYPAKVVLACTIPSVRSIFFLTMLMATVWIIALAYLLAWFLTVLGYNCNIPDSIMGLTFLAAGTSIPEAASSFIVSKKGYGSMSICNAIGSNTFNIFMCLGLPWVLKNLISKDSIAIDSSALTITNGLLVFTAVILYGSLLITKFVIGKVVGWISLISYVLFVIMACVLEMLLYTTIMCDIEES
ncbi:sodium/potassium/calcium exchanger 4 [Drosophila ficusphila]|uniref:sodium/potassium/calcium exchanger 4 n=1 Tax=Drosophila ficusphila TaxID=30025 RepID=UPI0007E67617|nr:sodium/potassium/calcium exchanger 4 [Drosophila ficusphila]